MLRCSTLLHEDDRILEAWHRAGACFNHQDHDGRTPLHLVSTNIQIQASGQHSSLTAFVVRTHVHSRWLQFALNCVFDLQAACMGLKTKVEALLQYGASPNVKDRFGQTPLDEARRNSHTQIVTLLSK